MGKNGMIAGIVIASAVAGLTGYTFGNQEFARSIGVDKVISKASEFPHELQKMRTDEEIKRPWQRLESCRQDTGHVR